VVAADRPCEDTEVGSDAAARAALQSAFKGLAYAASDREVVDGRRIALKV
jgi:hypothetical protein